MPRRKAFAPVPETDASESELMAELRSIREKITELERRLGMVEEKLNGLTEQFMDEFGEDFEEDKEEENEKK